MTKARRRLIALVAIILVAGVGLFAAKDTVRWAVDVVSGKEFLGDGHGSVTITILPGDTGVQVAQALVEAGVTASYPATYREVLRENATFYPGQYQLSLGMSSGSAISALTNGGNRVEKKVLIKEGWRASQIFAALSKAYNVPLADFESVSVGDLALPKDALNLDGYLFPATYSFTPGQSAVSMLRAMHERMVIELDKLGVSMAQQHDVLTMAALVQREGRSSKDFAKISRVFLNRIDAGMHLQSDATVSYGVNSKTVTTTAAQRADDNPWNTYLHAGLPAGPISAPGSAAISAALHPASGDWLYFCTVNLDTGETEFNATYSGHLKSVAKWQAWMAEHPGWN
jgi:UPF0755 protein